MFFRSPPRATPGCLGWVTSTMKKRKHIRMGITRSGAVNHVTLWPLNNTPERVIQDTKIP